MSVSLSDYLATTDNDILFKVAINLLGRPMALFRNMQLSISCFSNFDPLLTVIHSLNKKFQISHPWHCYCYNIMLY